MMAVTGANVPPELFQRVLGMMIPAEDSDVWITEMWTSNYVMVEKRELGNCALVSRYWARQCQWKIFQNIWMRSRDDVYELLALLSTPGCRVAGYIRKLKVPVQKYPFSPWVHLLSSLYPKFPARGVRISYELELDGTDKPSQLPIRSIHVALPRCPPTFSSRLKSLNLQNVHFRNMASLSHLVAELHDLDTLVCTAVTWGGETPSETLPRKGSHAPLHSVRMSECTSNSCAAYLLFGLRPVEESVIAQDDWACVYGLFRLLDGNPKEHNKRQIHIERYTLAVRNSNVFGECVVMLRMSYSYTRVVFRYHDDLGGVLHTSPATYFTLTRSVSKLPASQRHTLSQIHRVAVDLSPRETTLDDAFRYPWGFLDEHVSRLPEISDLILGFRTKEDMITFARRGGDETLPRLSRTSKPKYLFRCDGSRDPTRNWMLASPLLSSDSAVGTMPSFRGSTTLVLIFT